MPQTTPTAATAAPSFIPGQPVEWFDEWQEDGNGGCGVNASGTVAVATAEQTAAGPLGWVLVVLDTATYLAYFVRTLWVRPDLLRVTA